MAMNQRRSPPKHRHDGTSPLPLGMDWSPAPRKWNGRDTVWPHDPRTGWSYCVTIPSWVVLPKSRDSDPVVTISKRTLHSLDKEDHQDFVIRYTSSFFFWFYRVQVGLQSPEGITTTRGVLRRFNHFLKLFTDLKKAFPKKNIPPAPPKGLLRMKSRALLEERRCSLEEWMTKLLSDIDLSRSISMASFLELEAAARSSFQDVNQNTSEANPSSNSTISSLQMPPNSGFALIGSSSVTSDYGSDTAYETSELGTPKLGRDNSSEIGVEDLTLDEDLTSPIENLVKYGMSNIDEGLFMGQTILEQLEGFPRHKAHARQHPNNATGKNVYNGNVSKALFLTGDGMDLFSEPEPGKVIGHARKLSADSVRSDASSIRGSEISNSVIPNSSADGSPDLHRCAEVSSSREILGNSDLQFSGDAELVIPLDQRHKLSRVLLTMERRLVTAKTDMEDLITRLNQEMAVKDYLMTKVKDLEVELETTKQKSKETLQQAILSERERLTQIQWDMEELRRKSLEMEWKLKSKQDGNSHAESMEESTVKDKNVVQELDATKEQLENLSKRYEELEAKSKADIKVLVKEVKSLRSSQIGLKQELSQMLNEKSKTEELLQQERQMHNYMKTVREKLLHECRILLNRFQACNVNLFAEEKDNIILESSSVADALALLTSSDDQISRLTTEAQLLAEDSKAAASANVEKTHDNDVCARTDDALREVIADILGDNAKLRKQVNSVLRQALLFRNNEAPPPSRDNLGDDSSER